MDSDWASQRLNQIRTLMDRSASYRRALAPTTLATGIIGLIASGVGWYWKIESPHAFTKYWLSVAVIALLTAILMIRRQALQSSEPIWSLPTQRIAEAMSGPFVVGLIASLASFFLDPFPMKVAWWLPSIWMVLYGCGLYSAGFFMPRGIKFFGMGFIVSGCLSLLGAIEPTNAGTLPDLQQAHLVMGGSFGFFHLAYGLYLYLTENKEDLQ
jgi:hypothetical protein